MKISSLLAFVIGAIAVQADNTYYDLNCQTSSASPSATDLNNMGLALQAPPQASKQYCMTTDGGVDGYSRCDTIVTYNTAALNLCSTNVYGEFCIFGSELGKQVQSMAINCRNGNNLCGGTISVLGADGAPATLEFFHA